MRCSDEAWPALRTRGHGREHGVYGALKMWRTCKREGIAVARSTVERLMAERLAGLRRGKACGPRSPTRRRHGRRSGGPPVRAVPAPNRLLVADLTYVELVTGVFVYVAFVIDAYAAAILGWEASRSRGTPDSSSRDPQAARCGPAKKTGHPIEKRYPPYG